MELLNTIVVDHIDSDQREITLNSGRLIAEPSAINTDYLLISTRPGEYGPEQGGSVAELAAIGVSVEALERDCEADFRPLLPCWISRPQAGRFFKRLVVYEPLPSQAAPDAWQVFQALRSFAGNDAASTLALPVLNMHEQDADSLLMLRMQVFAAASLAARAHWSAINIVVPPEVAVAASLEFQTLKARYMDPPLAPPELLQEVAHIQRAHPQFNNHTGQRAVPPEEVGLTARQYDAVHAYTMTLYMYLNSTLRAGDITSAEYAYFHATIEALSTGLAQMKKFRASETTVYRGVDAFDGIEDVYAIGANAREAAYTSCSRVSTSWSRDYRLIINSAIGKDVALVSAHPSEQEVLFDFGMTHLIYKIEKQVMPTPQTHVSSRETFPNTSDIQFTHL